MSPMEDFQVEEASKHKLRLKQQIGTGAFGQIYKGVYDGETVAVKTILCSADDSANALNKEMFFREARMLRDCDHRRVIGYKALVRMPLATSKTNGSTYALVMEYAKGGTLSQTIVNQMINPTSKVYSTGQAISWALDVASALEYLHMRSLAVLHRDVKCSNIMLTTADDGETVAKLSDFGLHVSVDSSKSRYVRRSSLQVTRSSVTASPTAAAAGMAAGGWGSLHSNRGGPKLQDGSGHTNASTSSSITVFSDQPTGKLGSCDTFSDKDSARMAYAPRPPARTASEPAAVVAAVATAAAGDGSDHEYSEVHDGTGSRLVYVGANTGAAANADNSNSTAVARTDVDAIVAALSLKQQQKQKLGAAAAAAVAASSLYNCGPGGQNSFRRPSHHPGGDNALPRLSSAAVAAAIGRTASLDLGGDANASLFANWDSISMDGSLCSMATVGTWDTDGTAVSTTDTAGTDSTDGDPGLNGLLEEMETVFNMTGRTGSCMYMAPEVYLNQHYNEKSDVFSFGVVLYELMARTLCIFSELPPCSNNPDLPDWYAGKVANGYRPSRPRNKSISDNMWDLITACWHQEPVMRPHMSEVVAALRDAVTSELERQLSASKPTRRFSFSTGVRRPSGNPQQQQQNRLLSQTAAGPPSSQKLEQIAADDELKPTAEKQHLQDEPLPIKQSCGCVIC